MRALAFLCMLFLPALTQDGTASLTGKVGDFTGAVIPGVLAELRLVHEPYSVMRANADDAGVYRFSSLPIGEYTLKLGSAGFEQQTVQGIKIAAGEQKRLGTIELPVAACDGHANLESLRLQPAGHATGSIRGAVIGKKGPIAKATVKLVREAATWGETRTDSQGKFEFRNLSPGEFGIRFVHAGFYSLDVRAFYVQGDIESVYSPVYIERCQLGICAEWLRRPNKPLAICE